MLNGGFLPGAGPTIASLMASKDGTAPVPTAQVQATPTPVVPVETPAPLPTPVPTVDPATGLAPQG